MIFCNSKYFLFTISKCYLFCNSYFAPFFNVYIFLGSQRKACGAREGKRYDLPRMNTNMEELVTTLKLGG